MEKMSEIQPPYGSNFQIEQLDNGSKKLFWYRPDGGPFKYFIILILILWVTGWFYGIFTVTMNALFPENSSSNLLQLFWPFFATPFGIFFLVVLYLTLKPHKPESLTFQNDSIDYSSGTTSPLHILYNRYFEIQNKSSIHFDEIRRGSITINGIKMGEIEFIYEKDPPRIYFYKDSKKIYIAASLYESDINWLYTQLEPWSKK